jgi:hypothetical protein
MQMKQYQKQLEKIDLLSIETDFLHTMAFNYDSSSKFSSEKLFDDFKNKLILSHKKDNHSRQERAKCQYIFCENIRNNIDTVCEKIYLDNKHLKSENYIYKKMDLLELKKQKIIEKLLLKIYNVRFGDKYCTFYRRKKEVVFFIVESAFISKIDLDGIIHILISGRKFLKGRDKLGKTTGVSSLPEGYTY